MAATTSKEPRWQRPSASQRSGHRQRHQRLPRPRPPKLVTDPNGNRQTVAFDALGMVIECDEPTADSANIDRYQHHQRGQAQVLPTQVIPWGQGVSFSQPSEHCCATQLMSYCPRFGVGRSQSRLLPHEIKGLTQ